ncbi:MAG: hypothetical protein KDH20_08960 [Rhodocyclaceae bacterium]|nr:hypothetical protein [Rhodocyclaceae bacterium]
MKIDQIPVGARFQLKGKAFTKVGPMTAAGESGGTTFIPKHAVLQPAPGEAPPAPPPPLSGALDASRVLAAVDAYHREALALVGEAGRDGLEAARQRLLEALA